MPPGVQFWNEAKLSFLLSIATVIKAFRKKDPDNNCRLVFLPLHSRLPFESAQKIFEPVEDYHRKVILATNMAESSITIPDISYVIDFCLTKKLICDNATNYAALQLVWADKASCEQRKGRAGRVKSGRVYRMVYQVNFSLFHDHCSLLHHFVKFHILILLTG